MNVIECKKWFAFYDSLHEYFKTQYPNACSNKNVQIYIDGKNAKEIKEKVECHLKTDSVILTSLKSKQGRKIW